MIKLLGTAWSALMLWSLSAGDAAAAHLITAKVVSGYSDCSLTDNGDGTSTAAVTLEFNATEGHLGGNMFLSRAMLFNFYDKNGLPQTTQPMSGSLDGTSSQTFWSKPDYVLIHGQQGAWGNAEALRARATVTFYNSEIAGWPAVAIRAANYVTGEEDMAEISGAAYITAGVNGHCTLIKDPASPPPFAINITVDAPDWALGEIRPGTQSIPLPAASDRLCLHYTDSEVSAKPFIINATSQNGVSNGRYQLKNREESSQVIPYELILENGGQQVLLPNNSLASLPLDNGGKTCFNPLFRTFAPKTIQPGDYSDVLTFTVVTPT